MKMNTNLKFKKRLLPILLVMIVAVAMMLPFGARQVHAAETYTLTVQASANEILMKDLSGAASLRMDLYKVAVGEKDTSFDTWHWQMTGAYKDLLYNEQTFDNAAFTKLASDAADIALKSGAEQTADASVTASGGIAKFTLTDLGPGLYVIIPRDASKGSGEDINRNVDGAVESTTVETDDYAYTFSPAIVAVPGKNADHPGDEIGTAQSFGDWTNDVQVFLKPEQAERLGSISVSKSLDQYEDSASAEFAFSVVATKNDETVYNNVVSIAFTKDNPNPEPYQIDNLPVGATVTVQEIYAPPSYSMVEEPIEVTVKADSIENAAFSNEFNGSHHGGGGIENQYERQNGHWGIIGRIINGVKEIFPAADQPK